MDAPEANKDMTEELVVQAAQLFEKVFGAPAQIAATAPGRVNLIGEHVDYNDGLVLPMAIPLATVVVGREIPGTMATVYTDNKSADEPRRVSFSIVKKDVKKGQPKWVNYVKGVVAEFPRELPCAFEAVIMTTVPVGGGLSSSASLEVATFTFLELLTNFMVENLMSKALACQKAEHNFADVPCGVMDQFACTYGKKNHALLIDCRSLAVERIRMPEQSSEVAFLVINSNVRHELSGGEYARRRAQCEEAAKTIGLKSLREAEDVHLRAAKNKLSDLICRRASHVVSEIRRVRLAASALGKGDFETFGKLMLESHISLRDDFEVSCPELDQLVDIAMETDGVYGSRMTGGGFGGCTVTLVKKSALNDLINQIEKQYAGKATFHVCTAAEGAEAFRL